MPYESSNKVNGVNPAVIEASRQSLSAAGPNSEGDDSKSSSLSPANDRHKDKRFKPQLSYPDAR